MSEYSISPAPQQQTFIHRVYVIRSFHDMEVCVCVGGGGGIYENCLSSFSDFFLTAAKDGKMEFSLCRIPDAEVPRATQRLGLNVYQTLVSFALD